MCPFCSLSNMICMCSSNKINNSPKLHKATADCTTPRIPCLNHVRIKALGVSILVSPVDKEPTFGLNDAIFQVNRKKNPRKFVEGHFNIIRCWWSCERHAAIRGTEVVLVHDFKEGSFCYFSFAWLSSCPCVCEAENYVTDSGCF